MNVNTLKNREIIYYDLEIGYIEDYGLAFNCDGYEGVEPRFANIVPIENNEEE